MNYYEPRQIGDGPLKGRWHYTCKNDGRIWPVGNCAEGCDGHETPEAASVHQLEYEFAHARFRPDAIANQQVRCEALVGVDDGDQTEPCGEWTQSFAQIGPGIRHPVYLCADHLNLQGLASVVHEIGVVISS